MSSSAGVQSILVCEDDEAFRKRLSRSLRDRGLKVLEATSAEDAVRVANEYSLDAAVLDVRMPGKGGIWGVEQLHAQFPAMKIVVLTGFGAISSALDAVRAGALDYLTKPVNVDVLLAALNGAPNQNRASPKEPTIPSLEAVQTEYINRVVHEFSGNISRAAKALGLHRRSLQRMIKARGGES